MIWAISIATYLVIMAGTYYVYDYSTGHFPPPRKSVLLYAALWFLTIPFIIGVAVVDVVRYG